MMRTAEFHGELGQFVSSASLAKSSARIITKEFNSPVCDKSEERAQNDAQRSSQSGFLSQSLDEIARLYVEAPFSW